jgi:hypothetical protein
MRLEVLTAPQSAALLPEWKGRAGEGIRIPFFDLGGSRNGYFRFRRRNLGFAGIGPKYLSPAASAVHPYFVPGPFSYRIVIPLNPSATASEVGEITFQEIARRPEISLGITEGEFKAACCTLLGEFPVIGLGGVWAWLQKKRGVFWLPELEEIEWKGRHVPLLFDYSPTFNPGVTQALFALATELTNRGALPYLVNLPGPEKGIDDYLVAKNAGGSSYPDAINALLWDPKLTSPWAAARDLFAINERYLYVEKPAGRVYRPETDELLSKQEFEMDCYNRKVVVPKVNKKGEVQQQQVPAPRAWLEWGQRATATRLAFRPTLPPQTYLEDGSFNTWTGLPIQPKQDKDNPEGVKEFAALLAYLFSPPPGAPGEIREQYRRDKQWFTYWLVKPLQEPGFHLLTAVVLISRVQGIGKNLLADTVGQLYGGADQYYSPIDNKTLEEPKFNPWMYGKLFVHAEDIEPRTREISAAQLKVYITGNTVRINQKYQRAFTVDNHVNLLFTSNKPGVTEVEFRDRRYAVFRLEAPQNLQTHPEWGLERITKFVNYFFSLPGKQALMYWAQQLKIPKAWNPQAVPQTEARIEAQEATASSGQLWVREARLAPEDYFGRKSRLRLWMIEDISRAMELWPQYSRQDKYQDLKLGTVREWMLNGGWFQLRAGKQIEVDRARYRAIRPGPLGASPAGSDPSAPKNSPPRGEDKYVKVRLWCRTEEDFKELNSKQPHTLAKLFLAEREALYGKYVRFPGEDTEING